MGGISDISELRIDSRKNSLHDAVLALREQEHRRGERELDAAARRAGVVDQGEAGEDLKCNVLECNML